MGWDQSESGYGLWSLGKGPPQQMRACGGYGPGEWYGPGRGYGPDGGHMEGMDQVGGMDQVEAMAHTTLGSWFPKTDQVLYILPNPQSFPKYLGKILLSSTWTSPTFEIFLLFKLVLKYIVLNFSRASVLNKLRPWIHLPFTSCISWVYYAWPSIWQNASSDAEIWASAYSFTSPSFRSSSYWVHAKASHHYWLYFTNEMTELRINNLLSVIQLVNDGAEVQIRVIWVQRSTSEQHTLLFTLCAG